MVHRWVDVSWEDFLRSQVLQGWHKDEDAERRRCLRSISLFEDDGPIKVGEYVGLISSPLTETRVIPHTVLVYGDAENITHVIHALTYEGENWPTSSFEGYGESCTKGGLLPFLTHMPQVVIPGSGDRAFSGTYDYEIALGFPVDLLATLTDNLFKSGGNMNPGQPLRTMLPMGLQESITPGFKFLHGKMEEKRRKT